MNKNDLEKDLLQTTWIVEKCKNSETYSQNLYAALCNNRFFKHDEEWTCSWRCSGGIVAKIRDCNEDYLHWYCSGIVARHIIDIVGEGFVTDEIRTDLSKLGWEIKSYV